MEPMHVKINKAQRELWSDKTKTWKISDPAMAELKIFGNIEKDTDKDGIKDFRDADLKEKIKRIIR